HERLLHRLSAAAIGGRDCVYDVCHRSARRDRLRMGDDALGPGGLMALTWFLEVRELRRALGVILVLALAVFLLFPLLTLIVWAFADSWRYPSVVPQVLSLRWWDWVFTNGDISKAVFYSVITAPVVTLVSAAVCLPAAYSFSRLRFPGKRGFFVALLA